MVYNTHLAKQKEAQTPSNRIISHVFFYRYCDRVHHFPLMCFSGVRDAPNRPSSIHISETAVDIVVTQLFSPHSFPPPPHSVQLSHSCGCISKLPLTLSHTPLKENRVGDVFEEISENSIMPNWPQTLACTSLKMRPPALTVLPCNNVVTSIDKTIQMSLLLSQTG